MNCPECGAPLDLHGECPECGYVDTDYQFNLAYDERRHELYFDNKPEWFGLEDY